MEFRKLNILDMLESFYLDPSLCECLGLAMDASQVFGVNEFVVVADVEITKIQVVAKDKAIRLVLGVTTWKRMVLQKQKGVLINVITQQGNQVYGFFYFCVHLIFYLFLGVALFF